MKKIYILVFILFFLLFSPFIFAEKAEISIQHWNLKNKTRVFFVRRTELPMLDVELIFTAGSSLDKNEEGVSALTNAMIGEGAENLSSDQIAKSFENVGAEFHTIRERDMAGAVLRTVTEPQYLEPALRTFSAVISTPNFLEKNCERVKQQLIAQSQAQQQDPWQVASIEFFSQIYRNNFYAHNPLPTDEKIRALKRQQLIDFYKRYYTGANANLILVGNITDNQARKIAQQIAGNFPEGKLAPVLAMALNVSSAINKTVEYPASQSTILMGQVGITRDNPDYFSLMVGNAILGGLPSSLLFRKVREERGLAYMVSSSFNPLQYRGPFIIGMQTKSASTQEAIQQTKKILTDFVNHGPTDSQLQAAKKNIIGNFPLTVASNQSILELVSKIAFYHRSLDFLNTYQSRIAAITGDDVKIAFQKNIDLNKLVTVVVGRK